MKNRYKQSFFRCVAIAMGKKNGHALWGKWSRSQWGVESVEPLYNEALPVTDHLKAYLEERDVVGRRLAVSLDMSYEGRSLMWPRMKEEDFKEALLYQSEDIFGEEVTGKAVSGSFRYPSLYPKKTHMMDVYAVALDKTIVTDCTRIMRESGGTPSILTVLPLYGCYAREKREHFLYVRVQKEIILISECRESIIFEEYSAECTVEGFRMVVQTVLKEVLYKGFPPLEGYIVGIQEEALHEDFTWLYKVLEEAGLEELEWRKEVTASLQEQEIDVYAKSIQWQEVWGLFVYMMDRNTRN